MLYIFAAYLVSFAVFTASLLLQLRRFTFNDHAALFAAIYIAGAGMSLALAKKGLPEIQLGSVPHWCWLVLFVLLSASGCIYFFQRYPLPAEFLDQHPSSFFMHFNKGFVLSKVSDILFQQVVMLATYFWISEHTESLGIKILAFLLLFLVSHLFLIPLQGSVSAVHMAGALAAGVIFPTLLHFAPNSWPILIGAHWCFYPIARIWVSQLVV